MVIKVLGELDPPQLGNLRLCSHHWRQTCNADITSVASDVGHLGDALLFMHKLPNLDRVAIRGSHVDATTLGAGALHTLKAPLTTLEITSSETPEWDSDPKMVLRDVNSLLFQFSQSLRHIHLSNCSVPGDGDNTLHGPGFFSRFPHLSRLHLIGLRATPILSALDLGACLNLEDLECSDSKFSSLSVTGCPQLQTLHCECNSLSSLDLSKCPHLLSVNCAYNNLQALDLSACPNLTNLDCLENNIPTLDLSKCIRLTSLACNVNHLTSLNVSTCYELRHIDCSSNHLLTLALPSRPKVKQPALKQGEACAPEVFLSSLSCDAVVFPSLSSQKRGQLLELKLNGPITGTLAGFERLRRLYLESAESLGTIDLTACSSGVELNVTGWTDKLPMIVGGNTVSSVNMWGSYSLSSADGFTALAELHLNNLQYSSPTLDLCFLRSTLRIFEMLKNNPHFASHLKSIVVSGCSSLEVLRCDKLTELMELDLTSCVALTVLSCVGSSLASLDVSRCPLLTEVDIPQSKLLVKVTVNSLNHPRHMACGGCPKLTDIFAGAVINMNGVQLFIQEIVREALTSIIDILICAQIKQPRLPFTMLVDWIRVGLFTITSILLCRYPTYVYCNTMYGI